jgi:uncharacterized protein (TIGR00304 family)
MNKFHFFSLFCLIFGLVFFYIGFLSGEVETGFFIIFPFISGSGIYAFLGFILIVIAIFLFMFSFASFNKIDEFQNDNYELKPKKKTSIKGGGIILIGPIPIVFGSNWKIAAFLMIIALIIILVYFILFVL